MQTGVGPQSGTSVIGWRATRERYELSVCQACPKLAALDVGHRLLEQSVAFPGHCRDQAPIWCQRQELGAEVADVGPYEAGRGHVEVQIPEIVEDLGFGSDLASAFPEVS